MSGSCQGSEPLARKPSESRITGVRYFTAMRAASIAASKQCTGLIAATTGSGASPCRPNRAMFRSAASVLVGRPVDGPPRWMSTISSGSSTETASEIVSLFRARPGPLVAVTPRWPANAAPRAMPTAAISSSAWIVRTPKCLCLDSSWRMSEAGVMGYEPNVTGSLASWPAVMMPHARAVLPVTLVYSPAGIVVAGRTSKRCPTASVVSPKWYPARKAARLAPATSSSLPKRCWIHSSVASVGRVYIHDTSPRAKKFFERSASRGLTPSGAEASLVSDVIGTLISR